MISSDEYLKYQAMYYYAQERHKFACEAAQKTYVNNAGNSLKIDDIRNIADTAKRCDVLVAEAYQSWINERTTKTEKETTDNE